jgi:hypothetical protein
MFLFIYYFGGQIPSSNMKKRNKKKKRVVAYSRPTLGIHISHFNQGLCFFFILKSGRWIIQHRKGWEGASIF